MSDSNAALARRIAGAAASAARSAARARQIGVTFTPAQLCQIDAIRASDARRVRREFFGVLEGAP